jgi:DNA replication ATP-dependent helicase Dna2
MTKVLTAKDYACILGMPGTGKTTTIAEIILALVRRGKSVLLTSYTHSAVDTILTKLVNSDHKILRLGNVEKVTFDRYQYIRQFVLMRFFYSAPQVHPDVRHLTLEAFADPSSLPQLEDTLMSPQIVATTCLSIDQ